MVVAGSPLVIVAIVPTPAVLSCGLGVKPIRDGIAGP